MTRGGSKRAAATALALLVLAASTANADDALDQAKTYFSAGAQAYDAGRFGAAVQAFQQAYARVRKGTGFRAECDVHANDEAEGGAPIRSSRCA